jgi:Methyltransferase domain
MENTPIHDQHNPDLLALIPARAARIVEPGCSSGALARAYRAENPDCEYIGIGIDRGYAETARAACSRVICADPEQFDDREFAALFPSDCWVFGDVLEHIYDPWTLLKRIRRHGDRRSQVVACIPNVQHWSVQARLCPGQFRYEDRGLLDRTHIRWFTRITMVELFESSGFKIVEGGPRIFNVNAPRRETALAGIRQLAASIGLDPEAAARDALPLQWVLRALPAG